MINRIGRCRPQNCADVERILDAVEHEGEFGMFFAPPFAVQALQFSST
jgi:hypothetical protein